MRADDDDDQDAIFRDPNDLDDWHVNPPLMEIKVTPPSADNTPPSSPADSNLNAPAVGQAEFSQPLLPTPSCNIVQYLETRPF